MTSKEMSGGYLNTALGRIDFLNIAMQKKHYHTVVREAQEIVELFLKGILRFVGVEPTKTHDQSETLKKNKKKFPEFFEKEIDYLCSISIELTGQRGISFYGDERLSIPPHSLFTEEDAKRAIEQVLYVKNMCEKLVSYADLSFKDNTN